MKPTGRWVFVALVALSLGACGGGGGGGGDVGAAPVPVPVPVTPEVVRFSVGGTLAGLGSGKTVVLAHVDAAGATVQSASLTVNGRYALTLPAGTAYNLRVIAQPAAQTCTVANGTGTANANVDTISVSCADTIVPPQASIVSGTVAGLPTNLTSPLVLQMVAGSATQETTVGANGSFSFPQGITGSYVITVRSVPNGQGCTVTNGQGTAEGGAPAITVTCAAITYRLGGSVTGNAGVVALRNTANGETLAVNGNGAFTFIQPVLSGGSYAVVVADQSAGQSCSVANGSGTANTDVTGVAVRCQVVVVGAPPPPPPVPVAPTVPANLTMTYGIKGFNIAWSASAGATSYQLFEDPDGPGPAAGTQIGGALASTTYTHGVTGLLHTRLNAQYTVKACNAVGCSPLTGAITPNLTQAIGYFKASNTGANDRFGFSVAVSSDGNTMAVGVYSEDSNATGVGGNQADNSASDSGAVYVFNRGAGVWSQQAYIKASNAEAGDIFGYSVALSPDGNTLAVGAPREGSNATGVGGNEADNSAGRSGAVYVFTRGAGAWSQQAYIKASNTQILDSFGVSVALSSDGNTLAAGAPFEASNATGVGGNQADNSASNSGAVYVFTRSAGAWSQQAYIKASNTGLDDRFGWTVALASDSNTLAVGVFAESSNATGVGGNQADNSASNSGAVYVFTRSAATWSQQAYIKASNTAALDLFGSSVALSSDGDTLAVGAYGEGSNATGVGGNQADNSAGNSGAVYVFTRSAGAWSQQAYIKASNTGAGDRFGYSVALSSDGSTLAVGADGEASNVNGIGGNQADNALPNAGAVYLFTRSAGSWSQQTYIKASNTDRNDQFGYSVALSSDGSTLAVGAFQEASSAVGVGGNQADNSVLNAGAVYIY